MISYLPMGRMGNALFQSAAMIALALRNGVEFAMPKITSSEVWSPVYLQHLVNPKWVVGKVNVVIEEKQFHYVPIEYKKEWDNQQVQLRGYFQDERHFIDFKDEIIKLFDFPYSMVEDTCSIHARYSDYLTIHGKHVLVDEPYLHKAMDYIMDKTGIKKFKVHSDDISLFKERHGNLYDFEYSTNDNEIDDLISISNCHSQINSSSTFSWWGAYLNRNPEKVVITLKNWFQEGWRDHHGVVDTSKIIPSSWIKI